MSMSDTLGDMLTRIRNGLHANKTVVEAPSSKFRAKVLDVLQREGYIRGFESIEHEPGMKRLKIELIILLACSFCFLFCVTNTINLLW